MRNLYGVPAIFLGACFALSASAQSVSVTWPLTASPGGTSAAPTLVTAAPEVVAGTPAMQVFDYWSGQAQRLWAGTTGWMAGSVNPARYIQFDAAPTPGNQLSVTGVSFNYGGAGINGHIRSEVRYSVDNWSTFAVVGTPPLAYPNPAMLSFTQSVTAPAVASGGKFSLRIYPYAILNSVAMSPTFASHSNVVITGTSAPVAGGKVSFEIRKTAGSPVIPGTYWFTVMCNAPNGTPYAPVTNPVGIVLPGSGSTTISVSPGHFCGVTETPPTTGNWNVPGFSGSGVGVAASGWEAKVGPVTTQGGFVTVANRPKGPTGGETVRFDIRKGMEGTQIPGTYLFNVTCNLPNGSSYSPTPNPVGVVYPNPGVSTVSVPAGAICAVKEIVPLTGAWNAPVFAGGGVGVSMGAPWEAKVGPIAKPGGVVRVTNVPRKEDAKTVRFDIRKGMEGTQVPGTYLFNVTCNLPNGSSYSPTPNPVGVVYPNPGVSTVSVPAGAICAVKEIVPLAGAWNAPVFVGGGVGVSMGAPWEAKVGPIANPGGVVRVTNVRGKEDAKAVRFDIHKRMEGTQVPGTYLFNVACNLPDGTSYSPTPNPVSVVYPSPGVSTVSVPARAVCIIKEVQPAGNWTAPTFTASGMGVDMGAPWEAKVGPMTAGGGAVTVVNRPGEIVSKSCPAYQFTANLNVGNQIFSTVGGVAGAPLNPQTNNGTIEKFCYGNSAANCAIHGGLYEWDEAMGYAPSNNNDLTGARVQGICPAGFHIPSDLEWARYAYCQESTVAPTGPTPLATFQNPASFGWMGSTVPGVGPGEKMKTPFGSFTPAWTGSNASGFAALPSGSRILTTGVFDSLGAMATHWSATQGPSATRAFHSVLDMVSSSGRWGRNLTPKAYGMSVRCMKDYP